MRSLFTRAKKNGTIFKNPTSRIRVGQQEHGVIQPLDAGYVQSVVTVVARPADRLVLALAAVHAARPGAIRRLQLDDLDTIITVRSLIRRSWRTHRWDERPNRRP